MAVHHFTIYDAFRRNASLFRNKTGIKFEDHKITFGELFDQVNKTAGWFAATGITKGDRIAVVSKNRPELFVLMGAAAASGAILVPINYRLSREEISHHIENTRPLVVFVDQDYEETMNTLKVRYPYVQKWISMGVSGDGFDSFATLLNSRAVKPVDLNGDAPFAIIHTAAVQGKPYGAVITHNNMISGALQSMTPLDLLHDEVYLNILPLYHIGGLSAAFRTMYAGGVNVIIEKFDAIESGRIIDREKVTIIGNFPPILAQLLDARDAGHCMLSSLKNVYGLEHPDTIKRFEDIGEVNFWMIYGQTETMGVACLCRNKEKPGSAGRPGPLVDIMIADEYDRPLDTGKQGEILIRGPLVFSGYWGEEELTKHTFRDGWHHTGDVGLIDEEAFLWFVGRKAEKELIKPGGENVYPVEVEKVILEHPDVIEACVIGVPHPKFGEGIKAVCVLKSGGKLTDQGLIDFVAERIARYKKPNFVEFVESLQKQKDGSIDRAKVKELYGYAV
jgi:long-chain acyl-CoA synthetase